MVAIMAIYAVGAFGVGAGYFIGTPSHSGLIWEAIGIGLSWPWRFLEYL